MTDSTLVFLPGQRITGSDGAVVPGAVVYFYDAGTTSPRTVYSDSGLSNALGTSVTCDAGGYPSNSGSRVLIWTGTASYKIVCKDADGATLWTHDNLSGAIDTSGFLTTPSTSIDWRTTSVSSSTTWTAADVTNTLFTVAPGGSNVVCTLPDAALADGLEFEVYHNSTSGTVTCLAPGSATVKTIGTDGARKALLLINRGDSVRLKSNGVDYIATSYGNPFATRVWVVESQVTSPPGSPTVGAAYLIVGTPSGGFTSTTPACADGDVVVYDGQSNWQIFRPSSNCGWLAYDKGTSTLFQYRSSAWSNLAASDSVRGVIEIATQAEMEAASDATLAVTAGRAKYHPGMVKARGSFSGAGSVAESYNITSVSRTAAGTYTVTIADDFATSDYTVMASAVPSGTYVYAGIKISSKAAGSFVLTTTGVAAGGGTTTADMTTVDFAIVGDFA